MGYSVIKRNKRLWIRDEETNEAIYTPPDFVQINSRSPIQVLAAGFTKSGRRDINLIAQFEWDFSKRNVHRTRNHRTLSSDVGEEGAMDPENAGKGPIR